RAGRPRRGRAAAAPRRHPGGRHLAGLARGGRAPGAGPCRARDAPDHGGDTVTERAWHASYAHLPGGLVRDVVLVAEDGRFTRVLTGIDGTQAAAEGAERLPGVVLPGFANCHSHAFHRALRGRTHTGGGTFWTWREGMYAVAERLDPDRYLELATAVYAEMALAGVTAVGEFHYLHHGPGGVPYDDPSAMGQAPVEDRKSVV